MILVFGVIVFVHEFGHFIVARMCRVKVNEFAIGMGPKVAQFGRGETLYTLRLLPVGGYCMMEGQLDDSDDENAFSRKPAAARLAILFAGPFFNFLLAFLLSIVICQYTYVDPSVIKFVEPGSAAEVAGLEAGDEITYLNGSRIYNFREISLFRMTHDPEKPIEVTYKRGGEERAAIVTLTYNEEYDAYMFGITGDYHKSGGLREDIIFAALEVRLQIKSVIESLKTIFTGRFQADDLAGPVGIANMMGDVIDEAQESGGGMSAVLLSVINFVVLLSANLGVMNLLPVPSLDGGRIILVLTEAVSGRKVPEKAELLITGAGAVLLLILMVFVFFNDIGNLFN